MQTGLPHGTVSSVSAGSTVPAFQTVEFICRKKQELSRLKKEIYHKVEPYKKRKNELNEKIVGEINEIESFLKEKQDLTPDQTNNLHILLLEYGMAALKYGDTDWETFALSQEIFLNNEKLVASGGFSISRADQEKRKITREEREYAWKCCQYNFAHNITYYDLPPPADPAQEGFSVEYKKLIAQGISEVIAIAVTNARLAKKICLASLEEKPSLEAQSTSQEQSTSQAQPCSPVNPSAQANLTSRAKPYSRPKYFAQAKPSARAKPYARTKPFAQVKPSSQAQPFSQSDPLEVALISLNRFYDAWLQCKNPEQDWSLILEGRTLNEWKVYLPAEIKQKLDLD